MSSHFLYSLRDGKHIDSYTRREGTERSFGLIMPINLGNPPKYASFNFEPKKEVRDYA